MSIFANFHIRLAAAYVDPQAYARASSAEIEDWWTQIEAAADNGDAPLTRRIMGRNASGKWKRLDEMNGRRAELLHLAVTWQEGVDSTPNAPPV